MTIILFLVDTSASMCQKAYINGVQKSYLDIAKSAVETFLKYRQRSADCMGDRYMLLTFEDPPANVKAGWKENHATFMNELKNLQSNGLTCMGEALRNAFDLLNLNRMQSGIDTYGQGRCPFYLEPSVIIVITDGGKYSYRTNVQADIVLPLTTHHSTKLTKEPFRWDQRLFSLVLRMAGNKMDERPDIKIPHDESPIEKMCEVTGGRSYRVRSQLVLNQCIEQLVQKVQPGVVCHFEVTVHRPKNDGSASAAGGQPPEAPDLAFQLIKKMIFVPKHPTQKTFSLGWWPIPEPYWPDSKASVLPPREAHPRIRVCSPCVEEPALVHNFPIDKYEVEPSPLTMQILCKREPTKCWPVYIANGMHATEMPFGYLKASAQFTQVHLIILPYNYMVLLPLLNELFLKFCMHPPNEWFVKFTAYIRAIPQYYGPFLRRALASANVPVTLLQYILPENLDSYLSPTMAGYLKTMKNTAKQEQENMCLRVFKQLKMPRPPYHQVEVAKLLTVVPLRRDLVSHPQLRDTFVKMHAEITQFDSYNITVPCVRDQPAARNFRNPYDVPRRDLIDELARMRENFVRLPVHGAPMHARDAGHSLPIADMGNYQEYLKNKPQPLREIEPTNVRQHMFGNPYKKDKHMVMVDEADVNETNGRDGAGTPPPPMMKNQPPHPHPMMQQQQPLQQLMPGQPPMAAKKEAPRPRKRKAGPIHRDYVFRRRLSGYDSDFSSMSGGETTDDEDSGNNSDYSSSGKSRLFKLHDRSSTDVSDDDRAEGSTTDGRLPGAIRADGERSLENGHVKLFVNGRDSDDAMLLASGATANGACPVDADLDDCVPVEPAGPPPPLPVGYLPLHVQHHLQQQTVMYNTAQPTIAVIVQQSHVAQANSLGQTTVAGPSALPPTLAASALAGNNHLAGAFQPAPSGNGAGPPANDFQAQEISKILQQCNKTNGSIIDSTASGDSASSRLQTSDDSGDAPVRGAKLLKRSRSNTRTKSVRSSKRRSSMAGRASDSDQSDDDDGRPNVDADVTVDNDDDEFDDDDATTEGADDGESSRSTSNGGDAKINNGSASRRGRRTSSVNIEPAANSRRRSNRKQTAASTAATASASRAAKSRSGQLANGSDSDSNDRVRRKSLQYDSDADRHPARKRRLNETDSDDEQVKSEPTGDADDRTVFRKPLPLNNNHHQRTAVKSQPPDDDEDDEDEDDYDRQAEIRQANVEVRRIIFRDVRRPGRDYAKLIEHLALVRGNRPTRSSFVRMCIDEALRFRRKNMAERIQEWWDVHNRPAGYRPANAAANAPTGKATAAAATPTTAAAASAPVASSNSTSRSRRKQR